jgi:hypothetical protein
MKIMVTSYTILLIFIGAFCLEALDLDAVAYPLIAAMLGMCVGGIQIIYRAAKDCP